MSDHFRQFFLNPESETEAAKTTVMPLCGKSNTYLD